MFEDMPATFNNVFVGIDPGLSGAVGILDQAGLFVHVEDLPTIEVATERTRHLRDPETKQPTGKTKRVPGVKRFLDADDIAEGLERLHSTCGIALLAIEDVGPMPKDGAISAFAFGLSVGVLQGILAAHGIKHLKVRPAVWKKSLQIPADKQAARAAAVARFGCPLHLKLKKHDGRAEALWLAKYAEQHR